MSTLSRRNVLSLGAALGLVGATGTVSPAWSWSLQGSIAGAAADGAVTDPLWVWDDTIDQLMAALLEQGKVPAINTAMASWVNNDDTIPSDLPTELRDWLGEMTRLPSWADPEKLELAADFNRRKDTYLFMLYGLGSGIMSTVIPREARSVYWSAGGADMKDRAAKTFSFGYDLADLNAFRPDGQFLVTANKTRLVHAAVRHLLPQSPYWTAVADEQDGIPISNGDILVTFHSLGTYVHKMFGEWEIPMTADEEEAFLHHWQVAISQLGVQDRFIPQSWPDAYAQSEQSLDQLLAPTHEGKDLAEVLLGLVSEVDLGLTRGLLNEFVRYALSEEIGDWYDLRRDPGMRALLRTAWPAYIAFREGTIDTVPTGYYVFDQFVRAIAMLFLNEGKDAKTTPITIPTGNRART